MTQDYETRPSLCSHKRNKIEGNKQTCIRCKRVKIDEGERIVFYLSNGVHYFTKEKKNETK